MTMGDFPHQRKRRAVHFVDAVEVHSYTPEYVAPPELWYTKSECDLMKLDVREDVLQVRAARASREREALDNDDDSTVQSQRQGACLVGIEHLLTPACMKENRACRARCTQAVLAEQAKAQARARKVPLTRFFAWEMIALASISETRYAVLRARKFGKLHQKSANIMLPSDPGHAPCL